MAAEPNGPVIEARRVDLGLKRSQLAELTGISYQHVYGIERGFNTPSREVLARIARALGCRVSELTVAKGSARVESAA